VCILPSNQPRLNDVQCSLIFAALAAIANLALEVIAVPLILGYSKDIKLFQLSLSNIVSILRLIESKLTKTD
jgi:hypothetical protein